MKHLFCSLLPVSNGTNHIAKRDIPYVYMATILLPPLGNGKVNHICAKRLFCSPLFNLQENGHLYGPKELFHSNKPLALDPKLLHV